MMSISIISVAIIQRKTQLSDILFRKKNIHCDAKSLVKFSLKLKLMPSIELLFLQNIVEIKLV